MAPKVCFLGAVRRRTMICCRNVKISASIAARDRNRSTTAQTMSLTRSLITDQHRPILGQPPANRFATGPMILLNAAIEIASRIDFHSRLDQSRSRLWYRKTRSLDAEPPLKARFQSSIETSARRPVRSVLFFSVKLAFSRRSASSTMASPRPLPDALLCRPRKNRLAT